MHKDLSILHHCREIDRCNQRGDRMLSIVDLVEAGTVDLAMAAFLMACVANQASFVIGARPGGAGKTTVMGALLNLLPPGLGIVHASSRDILEKGLLSPDQDQCYVCHEIGRGHFYSYLWGQEVADLFRLQESGAVIASNLHADTLEETEDQIVRQCGAQMQHFRKTEILAFLRIDKGRNRRVGELYWGDGQCHQLLWKLEGNRFTRTEAPLPPGLKLNEAAQVLDSLLSQGLRTLPEVRTVLVSHWFSKM